MSTETTAPLISTGSSPAVAAVVRTGGQALTPAFLLQGLRVFGIWEPSGEQTDWLIAFGAVLTAALQWAVERRRGRKLIGATPHPALPPIVGEVVDATGRPVAAVVAADPAAVEEVSGAIVSDDTNEIVGAVGPLDDDG